jgi:hypothetical protein
MYVYHAVLNVEWEAGYDLGLFARKADAKKACQDEQKGTSLVWDNSDRNRSCAKSAVFPKDGLFTVTRRPVR